jgi:hypothetical protein
MEVLEYGRNHPEWSRSFECDSCGSILKVHRNDLFVDKVGGQNPSFSEVQCICCACGKAITVDKYHERWKKLPSFSEFKSRIQS